ncbi:MAG: COG3904 family protein [Planctomycetota bacterium]
MEDQIKLGSEETQTLAKSTGVGTSVAAFGTTMLVFGAINTYFSGSMSNPDIYCGIALLVLGISSRKGKRGAMKACIWVSVLCLLGSLLATGLLLSTLRVSESGVEFPLAAYWYICLAQVIVLCFWSVTNIVWLFKVLKVTNAPFSIKRVSKQATDVLSSKQKSLNEIPEVIERNQSPKTSYIRKHWRGELSLAVSFWINLFLLNIVIFLFSELLGYSEILENPVTSARVVLVFYAFAILIVYPWQIIGLWRSCNNHIKKSSKCFWPRTAQVLVVLGIICTLVNLNSSWPTYKSLFRLAFVKGEFESYSIKLEKNDTLIHLQGGLGFGVSDEVAKLLKKYPEVKGIILDSIGGRIYEGRELAKLISAYDLDTYSLKGCYSAATIAFIAGKKRFIGMEANLAFHQYKMDYEGLDAVADMEEEQAKDLLIFKQQGVKSEFIERLFETSHDDLWYPTVDEMLDAGVIHGIVNPSDLLPIEYGFTSKEIEEASIEIEKALLDIPLYKTIKQYDPDTYREIMVVIEELIKKGATLIEAQRSGANIIQPLAFAALPRTSDEALIQFAQAFVYNLKKLKDVDPILCLKSLYPKQYGSVSFSKYFSDDESNLMLEALNKIVIDAYEKNNPPVDTEAAELLMEKLVLKLGEYADYLELENLQNTDDYGRHCDAVIKLYELILNEDNNISGNALRYMFSQK